MKAQGHTIVRRKAKNGTPGNDANLLPWVEEWNDNKVKIGTEYIVAPKMFSGTNTGTDDKPVLTGIAMGRDCLVDMDGNKRTGIFALVDNEIVFELDPINKKYKFMGRIESDEGYFTGEVNALSGTFKNGVFRDAVIETGRFGELNIAGAGLTNEGFDEDAHIILRNDKTDTFAGIGGNMYPGSAGGDLAIARFSTARRSSDSSNTGIIVGASGSSISNTAIDIDAGYVAGLNVKTEWLDGGTINRKTTFVQVNGTNYDPTITLPSNPEVGKIIYICSNNKAINVSGGNHNIYFDGGQRNTIHIGGAGRMSMFIFNGTHWACGLMAYA